jgi:pyruvate dehydrogenase E1 component beta subunit
MNTGERKLTIARAVAEAIALEMRADERVFVMGEDVGALGSVWGNTRGLLEEFGAARIRDTPISEAGFIGAAAGAAMTGMRPVVELMFVDFIGVCMDQLYNFAAKTCYFSGAQVAVPMVIMTAVGGGYSDAGQHSQCLYATFGHLPGMKIVVPSSAYDAKGLMRAAIRDDNPVVVMLHKALQGMGWLGTVERSITAVPREPYSIPLGTASVLRTGTDVTIVGLGLTVHSALDSAVELELRGIDAEVVDLRSVAPLDRATIISSVSKTGRLVVADEDYSSYGVAAEVIATAATQAYPLKAAPQRVAYPDIPIPFARPMEQFALPSVEKMIAAVETTLGRRNR